MISKLKTSLGIEPGATNLFITKPLLYNIYLKFRRLGMTGWSDSTGKLSRHFGPPLVRGSTTALRRRDVGAVNMYFASSADISHEELHLSIRVNCKIREITNKWKWDSNSQKSKLYVYAWSKLLFAIS